MEPLLVTIGGLLTFFSARHLFSKRQTNQIAPRQQHNRRFRNLKNSSRIHLSFSEQSESPDPQNQQITVQQRKKILKSFKKKEKSQHKQQQRMNAIDQAKESDKNQDQHNWINLVHNQDDKDPQSRELNVQDSNLQKKSKWVDVKDKKQKQKQKQKQKRNQKQKQKLIYKSVESDYQGIFSKAMQSQKKIIKDNAHEQNKDERSLQSRAQKIQAPVAITVDMLRILSSNKNRKSKKLQWEKIIQSMKSRNVKENSEFQFKQTNQEPSMSPIRKIAEDSESIQSAH